MATETCATCRFWDTSQYLDGYEDASPCRRRAPRLNKATGNAVWPFSEATDWCGEHQPCETEQARAQPVRD